MNALSDKRGALYPLLQPYPLTPSQGRTAAAIPTAAYLQQFKVKVLAQVDDAASHDDEYSRYIKERVEWVEDPIAWWLLQKHRYPNLSQMALDILSIPCMSADVERLFSSCGLTLEDRRNRMGPELLEALECLKSWQKIKEFNILESLVASGGKVQRRRGVLQCHSVTQGVYILHTQFAQCAYDRSIDFPGTVPYDAESHTVRIPICLHMEYLHFLYYCQHCE